VHAKDVKIPGNKAKSQNIRKREKPDVFSAIALPAKRI